MYFSKQTNSFYLHSHTQSPSTPEDALAVSDETYRSIIEGHYAGAKVSSDEEGMPILLDARDEVAELAAAARYQRDALLKSTDWTVLPDSPMKASVEYKTYRKALRDLTKQPDFPHNIKWPVRP